MPLPRALALALALLAAAGSARGLPVNLCDTRWFTQPLNHFSFNPASERTYEQRVLTYLGFWKQGDFGIPNGPLFFYFGNEADVELYTDHTGLMWQHAESFAAGLIFAEHRFYGQSKVDDDCSMAHLTTEQALADFAVVIDTFRKELKPSAVIGFGGSYGGHLAALFRFKYPHLVDGVVAASAPMLAYLGMNYDPNSFARVVTRNAGSECASLVKTGLKLAYNLTQSASGRSILSTTFKTCRPLKDKNEATDLLNWAQDHWNYLAMGSYPYPSSYVQPEGGMLPAWPVRAACFLVREAIAAPMVGLARAAFMFYNATRDKHCMFNGDRQTLSKKPKFMLTFGSSVSLALQLKSAPSAPSAPSCAAGNWDWQWCTEHVMPFTQGTERDMFYPLSPFDLDDAIKGCAERWGVGAIPRPKWAVLTFGGLAGLQKGLTNVVFSNGLLDPWSAGGVLTPTGFDASVVTVQIPNGGHHVDLMFSDRDDTPDIKRARVIELEQIALWIKQAKARISTPDHSSEQGNVEAAAVA